MCSCLPKQEQMLVDGVMAQQAAADASITFKPPYQGVYTRHWCCSASHLRALWKACDSLTEGTIPSQSFPTKIPIRVSFCVAKKHKTSSQVAKNLPRPRAKAVNANTVVGFVDRMSRSCGFSQALLGFGAWWTNLYS
jgi:hypothetical protein